MRSESGSLGRPWAWRPASGLTAAVFFLLLAFAVLSAVRLFTREAGFGLLALLQILVAIAIVATAIPATWRAVRQRLLWSLRNKLLLTYLLIGLAPFLLLLTLVLISAYIAAGQFAIHLVDSRIQGELVRLGGENASWLNRYVEPAAADGATGGASADTSVPPQEWIYNFIRGSRRLHLHPQITAYVGGQPFDRKQGVVARQTPLGLPPWALRLPNGRFEGVVLEGSELYLLAAHQRPLRDGRQFTVVSSLPITTELMEMFSDGLGKAALIPLMTGGGTASAGPARGEVQPTRRSGLSRSGRDSVSGGSEPPRSNIADLRVSFLSTLPASDWDTGEQDSIPIEVDSRPSLLYLQLFGGSLSGIVTTVIRIGLVAICVVFALIEALALWMAYRLSRTVTASVSDLYLATQSIDRGELEHRITVTREDQLAELGRSFNRMSGSLQRLLREQKEKERLQNEISIAQEVQANLFPRTISDLPTLELHGVCRPARAVSGDYYDFLVFHEEAHDGVASRSETGVGIALGDISGKGISAALLMATLHSAVRAYRFASEELIYSDSAIHGLLASREDGGGRSDELFESPGRILSLLNRHLYRSTQPEKYATLFLAHYDARTARLTYSNAGQLPPLVLGRDGSVRRLDRGGTVVGLMDGMHYEEDSLEMRSGDLMIAYSDGVTEPENDFGEFGEERLLEVVRRYQMEPLHVISMHVMQALDAWIGAEEQPDDITLVLARQR